MDLELSEREAGVLLGLATSATLEAGRDGRTGPWVDTVRRIVAEIERADSYASWRVMPTGGEPFGTKVTFWADDSTQHAVVICSPKPGYDSPGQQRWSIVRGDGVQVLVPAEALTLGWHRDGIR